ncbi:hypothetical protein SAMN05216559_0284 [Halomicrobium zhouii]|uniref:Lipoprotein n=1 Tax=Halomicrobium zhouii TaxID=767519 RepID=A0A1I6K6R4_9EURY|nr:hypothetical protein [Halomicrobium zhouii]SFR86933.1 hypothetical protein SAMN05216559_0284 [Halomicrobium zhouii]
MTAKSPLHLIALIALALLTAGCVQSLAGSPTATPTDTPPESVQSPTDTPTDVQTPPPNRTVELPEGPKERPERPETLTEDSVGEFVKTHEYRYAYNGLWYSEHSEVTLDCTLHGVTERDGWFEATVSCSGSSNTGGPAEGTEAVTELIADWSTLTYVYYVDENSLIREGTNE